MDVARSTIEDIDKDEAIELDAKLKTVQTLELKMPIDSLMCDDGLDDALIESRTRLGPSQSSDGLLLTRAEMHQLAARPRMHSQSSRIGVAPAHFPSEAPNSGEGLRTLAAMEATWNPLEGGEQHSNRQDLRLLSMDPLSVIDPLSNQQRDVEQARSVNAMARAWKSVRGSNPEIPAVADFKEEKAHRSEQPGLLVTRFRQLQSSSIIYEPPADTTPTFQHLNTRNKPLSDSATAIKAPSDLLHPESAQLPQPWVAPSRPHRYIVSLNLIQRRAVASALCSPQIGNVGLVEREKLWCNQKPFSSSEGQTPLDGPDVLIDPDFAVLIVTLASINTIEKDLQCQLEALSLSFSRITIVFEAYSKTTAYHIKNGESTKASLVVNMFTPPVLSGFNHWRRLFNIAVAVESISSGCVVDWAFAHTPNETAKIIRLLGDHAEEEADPVIRQHLWDGREWLQEEAILVRTRNR